MRKVSLRAATSALAVSLIVMPMLAGCRTAGSGAQTPVSRDDIQKRREQYQAYTQKRGGSAGSPAGRGAYPGGAGAGQPGR